MCYINKTDIILFSFSGFEGLISNLISELPTNIVTYNRPVRCVHWNNRENKVNPVMLVCDDGEEIAADHVIVTVSLGRHLLIHTLFVFFTENIFCLNQSLFKY